MKNIMVFSACVILLSFSLASAADLATGNVTTTDGLSIYGDIATPVTTAKTLIGKTSKGVKLGAAYNNLAYSLTTKHDSGTTQYGTAHDATAIYKQEVGTTALTAPSAAGNAAFGALWTSM